MDLSSIANKMKLKSSKTWMESFNKDFVSEYQHAIDWLKSNLLLKKDTLKTHLSIYRKTFPKKVNQIWGGKRKR